MCRNLLFTVLLSLGLGQTIATPEQSIPFNTARQMEKQNRIEEAIALYQSVLDINPAHAQAYRRLVDLLYQHKKYAALIPVIQTHLTHFPNDIGSRLRLAEVYYQNDQMAQAQAIWDALEANPSPLYYRQLFRSYITLGLESRLVHLVQQGRTVLNTPEFLALDLGNYYQARRVYDRAVNEYLLYVRYHPKQARLITSRLLIMSDEEEARSFIEQGLKAEREHQPLISGEILSAYYFKMQQFDSAYQEQLSLPLAHRADVERWLKFARSLQAEGQYNLAIRSYQHILSGSSYNPPADLGAQALIQMATAFEAKILPPESSPSLLGYFPDNVFFESHFYFTRQISDTSAALAFDLYDSVLVALPSSEFSALAHYRLGEIQYRITRNFDGALISYEAALRSRPPADLAGKIRLRLGDVFLAQGRLDEARTYFAHEQNRSLAFQTRYIQSLLLSGLVDSTRSVLQKTVATLQPQDEYFNDYLELSDFLSLTEDATLWQDYWQAERLIRQYKLSEAVAQLESIRHTYPDSPLRPYILLREALLTRQLETYDQAADLAAALRQTDFEDRGLVLQAELAEYHWHDTDRALAFYHEILETYPHSMLSEPVRLHIRTLTK